MNTAKENPRGSNSNTAQMEDMKAKLSTLWIFAMFNMAFADIFSFMYPGVLKQIIAGSAEGIQITPGFLLIAAIVTEIPIAMVFLSRLLKYGVNRWVNIIGGVITILWVIGGGSTTLHYIFFASIEVICSLVIIWLAWKWHNPEGQS
jgi:hypothetical protein